jgi:hypothetical protein
MVAAFCNLGKNIIPTNELIDNPSSYDLHDYGKGCYGIDCNLNYPKISRVVKSGKGCLWDNPEAAT